MFTHKCLLIHVKWKDLRNDCIEMNMKFIANLKKYWAGVFSAILVSLIGESIRVYIKNRRESSHYKSWAIVCKLKPTQLHRVFISAATVVIVIICDKLRDYRYIDIECRVGSAIVSGCFLSLFPTQLISPQLKLIIIREAELST